MALNLDGSYQLYQDLGQKVYAVKNWLFVYLNKSTQRSFILQKILIPYL